MATETRSRPRAGWLARPAHLPTLVRSLLPMLEARWRRVAMSWSGRLTLHLTADVTTDQPGGTYVLELAPGRLTLAEPGDGDSGGAVAPNNGHGAGRLCLPDGTVAVGQAQPAGAVARLLPGAFTQLLFGFRPVWWVAEQPGNDLPDPARLLLETLFPVEPAWIAPTDGF
jgi:hypothetical protein